MTERRKTKRSFHESTAKPSTPKKRIFEPANDAQREYIRLIAENQVVVAIGPAGSSKTAIPSYLACEKLISNEVQRIIITRPIIEAGRGIGFLKGGLLEKCDPYMKPLTDELTKWLGASRLAEAMKTGEVEVCPPEFMRGRNFHNCFIIVDEAQNCTMKQLKMILSRLGKRSKMVVNGDPQQTDLPAHESGALNLMYDRYKNLNEVGRIRFTSEHIVRNPLIGLLLERLEDENIHDTVCDDGEDWDNGWEDVHSYSL